MRGVQVQVVRCVLVINFLFLQIFTRSRSGLQRYEYSNCVIIELLIILIKKKFSKFVLVYLLIINAYVKSFTHCMHQALLSGS